MGNRWLERRVLNYAHQGGAREGPSSTLHAMRAALAAGAHALELDVHRTADGHLVVCHDATVDRTTERSGAIAAMTLAEVRSLDNAHWWVPGQVVDHDAPEDAYVHRGKAPDDPDFRIATLVEVLEAFPDVPLNLDIKQTAPYAVPYEQQLADVLRAHGRSDDVVVASFVDRATDAFHACAPEIPISCGTAATAAFHHAVRSGGPLPDTPHVALQVPRVYGEVVIVDEAFVEAAHRSGKAVHVWTIDDEAEMELLVDLGVDGIMTDRPTALAAVLRRRGAAFEGKRVTEAS